MMSYSVKLEVLESGSIELRLRLPRGIEAEDEDEDTIRFELDYIAIESR